jgi:thioredoxin-like negative regulator of GroEL
VLEVTSLEQWERETDTEFTVIAEFTQPTCMPCRKMKAILQMVEPEHLDVKFFTIDVTRLPELAGLYGISSTPVTIIVKGGKIKGSIMGVKGKAVVSELLAK